MIKVTLWIAVLAFGSYFLFCSMLYLKQRSMLYFPTPRNNSNEAEVLWLESEGERLKVWHVPGTRSKALLYFGGNAEDVALNLADFKMLFPGFSLFLLNYRGYGGSSGTPSEQGLFADARALFQEAAREHDYFIVMGRSLGTGVAAYLASEVAVDRLILVTPFDSMTNLASSYYPFIPVAPLLKDRFESASYLENKKISTLVLIAEHDEIIPRKRSKALLDRMNTESTQVHVIPNTGHNTIETHPLYHESISSFIQTD